VTGVLVCGMHHSGTSVITSLLADAGWHPGEVIVSDDPRTGKKFAEDAELVNLNREWLRSTGSSFDTPNDWGMSGAKALMVRSTQGDIERAKNFVHNRDLVRAQWVAKDPRTSLTLPIWTKVPRTKFLFIYRNPWDVVDSLTRYGAPFVGRSDWIRSTWVAYNQRILRALRQLGDRGMLVEAGDVLKNPERFIADFSQWAGPSPELGTPNKVIDPSLFSHRDAGSPIAYLYRKLYPLETRTLEALEKIAKPDRPTLDPWRRRLLRGGSAITSRAIQVVIPCRNDGQFLAEAIASVESASKEVAVPIELTIVDGGSRDRSTRRIFRRLNRTGYQVVSTKKIGPSAARNRGVEMSTADVVIPLDADNRIRPKLAKGAELVLNGFADIVYGPWQRFGLDNYLITPASIITLNSFVPHNTVDACAAISRRVIANLQGWDEDFVGLEDWDFWLRALKNGANFLCLNETIFDYMVRPESMTWSFQKVPESARNAQARVITRHLEFAREADADVSTWEEILSILSRQDREDC
jgi:GT2 family glycosyltransferase